MVAAAEAPAQDAAPVDTLVDVGGHRLHFTVRRGTVPATIVLETGGGATVEDWSGLADRVASRTGATVVAYDRAGFGRSELGPAELQPVEQVEQLDRALDELGVPRKRILVGASYGGLMALVHARLFPDRVAGLVLLDPMNPGFVDATGDFVHSTAPSFPDPQHDWQRASVRLARTFDSVLREARLAQEEVQAPVVIVTAGEPWWSREEIDREWRASHEAMAADMAAELVVAEGSQHRIEVERPDLVVEAVRAVLAAADASPPARARAVPACSDEEVERVVERYFALLSGPAGSRDWDSFRALFLSGARLDAIGVAARGESRHYPQSVDEYVAHIDDYVRERGFFHEPVSRSVECDGRLARARVGFRSRNTDAGPVIDRGEVLFHLLSGDGEWRIAHVMWQSEPIEREEAPVR